MAHTPGPWKARTAAGQVWLNGSNCYEVLEVLNPQGGRNPDDIRLMAAAPELLAACKLALDAGDQFYARSVIASAIEKAEGRSDA